MPSFDGWIKVCSMDAFVCQTDNTGTCRMDGWVSWIDDNMGRQMDVLTGLGRYMGEVVG